MRGDFTNVSQYTKAKSGIRKNVLHRFACIMWHGKGLHLKIADGQGTMTINDMQIKPEIGFTASNPRAVSHPDRQGKLSG
jgi:hypothetical protein